MLITKKRDKCFYVSTFNKSQYDTTDWLIIYFRKHFELSYELCGYFDNRPEINIALFFFHLTIKLPFRNEWTDECDPPKWGIAYHNQTFWIYRGGNGNMNGGNKWWTMYSPFSYQWVRTSNLRKDGTWEHETKGNRKDFYKDEWNGILWKGKYPYTYVLKSGEIQNRIATVKVSEREWRWHWFKWSPFPKKISRSIEIDFNGEVGEETGSWKGGCTGCGYDLRPKETPLQCLRRMEKERKF